VAAAHGRDKAVHVWTVNEAADMDRLVGLGVDGIISDLPTTLSGVLHENDVAWDGQLR
jgi:glycerophosphoryl diester phosphodiesterase